MEIVQDFREDEENEEELNNEKKGITFSKYQVYTIFTLFSTLLSIFFSIAEEDFQLYDIGLTIVTWGWSKVILLNFFFWLIFSMFKLSVWSVFNEMRVFEEDKIVSDILFGSVITNAFTLAIFRVDLNRSIIMFFIILSALKALHKLAELRTKHLESVIPDNSSGMMFLKILCFLILLLGIDIIFIFYSYSQVPIGYKYFLIFITESMILVVVNLVTFIRFSTFIYNFYRSDDKQWKNKGEFVFYLEIASDIVQSLIFIYNFVVIYKYFGFPIMIFRGFGRTILRIMKRVKDLIIYRRLSSNFDERFPNATKEEIELADTICSVCLQPLTVGDAKKLICGHLFHPQCLKDCLARHQNCPLCRESLIKTKGKKKNYLEEKKERKRKEEDEKKTNNNVDNEATNTKQETSSRVVKQKEEEKFENQERVDKLVNGFVEHLKKQDMKSQTTKKEEKLDIVDEKQEREGVNPINNIQTAKILLNYFQDLQALNSKYIEHCKKIITENVDNS